MTQILNRFTGKVICEGEESVKILAEKNKANLRNSDLSGSDLSGSDLSYSYLRDSDLSGSNLSYSDLSYSYLSYSYLRDSDLSGSNLRGSNLRGSDLSNAKVEFHLFPSIRLLSSIHLGTISDSLTLELMRRDAYAHPHPEKFDKWEKGGQCPYQNEERFWVFKERKGIWKKGKPQMTDRDLIIAICEEKGWKIRGHLK